ncbi:MAG: hypothetical protein IJ173_03750 [Kiritimatiellae bacterium]|nr:hypothetical protein [Kiritimatiellia bacterium]
MNEKSTKVAIVAAVSVALSAGAASGGLFSSGTPFADGMVLQRGVAAPVWGTASPGETVTVEFAGQSKIAKADASGAWRTSLDPMEASCESRTMTISCGGKRETIGNVLVGEVWFASGQSNMECPIWGASPRYRDGKGGMMTKAIRRPQVRFAKNPKRLGACPVLGWKAEWRDFTPESFKDCFKKKTLSAVAFYFALGLHDALGVPVGIVDSSVGGTNIDSWTPPCGYASHPALADVAAYPTTDKWDKSMATSVIDADYHQPSILWNGMVAAWAPFAIRGFIWYQGEHNAVHGDAARYCEKMYALRDGWAEEFKNPVLKLYFAQLAPFRINWFELQLAQSKFASEEKNAAMAATCDIGNMRDVHPNDKETVARRLLLHALKRDYGFADVIADSPVPKSWRVENGCFVVAFKGADAFYCYNADRSAPKGFEVAGPDGKFVAASVRNRMRNGSIHGKELMVGADGVAEPKRLRYLGGAHRAGSIYSTDSALPLVPFEVEAAQESVR